MLCTSNTLATALTAAALLSTPAAARATATATAPTETLLPTEPSTTATPAYCTSVPTDIVSLPYNPTAVYPPIPCAGAYLVQQGICCRGASTDCGSGDARHRAWELPLAACVTAHPLYDGCPGNMLNGTCCRGAGVGLFSRQGSASSSVVCDGGPALFTVRTGPGGAVSTSTFGGGSATAAPGGEGTGSATGLPVSSVVPTTLQTSSGAGGATATSSSSGWAMRTAGVDVDRGVAVLVLAGVVIAAAL